MLPEDWLDQIRQHYPKRAGGHGWGHLKKRIPELIRVGHDFEEMLEGVKRYAALQLAIGNVGTPYVMQARTFFGPGEWWLEDYDLPTDGSVELTLDQQAEQYGITRQEGEGDESLKKRLGIAMTMKKYG
jgi:hypothetical protein